MFKNLKIRTKLLGGFMTIALLVGVVGYISVSTSQKALQESIGEGSVSLVVAILDDIDKELANKISLSKKIAGDKIVQDIVIASNQKFEQLNDIKGYIDTQETAWRAAPKAEITPFMEEIIENDASKSLRKKLRAFEREAGYRVFGEIFLTNKYGANAAQTGKTTDYRQNDEEWWQIAKRDGVFIRDVEYDESADVYSTDIGIRIEGEDGNFLGVMKTVLNIQGTIDIVKESKGVAKFGKADFELLDASNRVIFDSKEEFEFLEDVSDREEIEKITGSSGFFVITESGEEEELISYARSGGYRNFSGLGWTLIVEYETDKILAPVTKLRNSLFLFSLAVMMLAIFIGLFIAHSISKAVARARDVAIEVSKGNMDVEIDTSGKDEVAELSQAIDKMRVSLKVVMEEYEKKIKP